MDVELVEDEEAAVAEEFGDGAVGDPVVAPVAVVGGVELAEEVVEVQPALVPHRHGLVEGGGQPALAAADRTPQVDPARRCGAAAEQPQAPRRAGSQYLGAELAEPEGGLPLGVVQDESGLPGGAFELAYQLMITVLRRNRSGRPGAA